MLLLFSIIKWFTQINIFNVISIWSIVIHFSSPFSLTHAGNSLTTPRLLMIRKRTLVLINILMLPWLQNPSSTSQFKKSSIRIRFVKLNFFMFFFYFTFFYCSIKRKLSLAKPLYSFSNLWDSNLIYLIHLLALIVIIKCYYFVLKSFV